MRIFDYRDYPVLSSFFRSNARVRRIMGPIGSGKTSACCMEIWRRGNEQTPSNDEYRYFRATVVRNTFPDLQRTTLKTWHRIFDPNAKGSTFRWSTPMSHEIQIDPGRDRPGLKLQVDFMAIEDDKAARSLLSLETNLIYINEGRELDFEVIDRAADRVGRYIAPDGTPPKWYGVIIDTNPPDENHWMYKQEMKGMPSGWEVFQQPPGVLECEMTEEAGEKTWRCIESGYNNLWTRNPAMVQEAAGTWWITNPEAENLKFLPVLETDKNPLVNTSYYLSSCASKDRTHIRSYLQGRYGFTMTGKPVVPEFSRERQVVPVEPLNTAEVWGGLDIGGGTLHSAAVLAQRFPRGNWVVFDEIVSPDEGIGLNEFIRELNARIAIMFPGMPLGRFIGDPAGEVRDGIYEQSGYDMLAQNKIPARAAPSNDIRMRIEAVKNVCNKLIDGKPALVIHPRCKILIAGLQGGWMFSKIAGFSGTGFKSVPEKNNYSHPCDALGYLLFGGGEAKMTRPQGVNTYGPFRQLVANSEFTP